MLTIEVDCNSDLIILREDGKQISSTPVKHPLESVKMFSEIFNRLTVEGDREPLGVELTKVDEDVRTQLEEW